MVWNFSRLLVVALGMSGFLAAGCHGPRMELTRQLAVTTAVTEAAFRDSLAAVIGTPFVGGNRITRLLNGDEIFPAMLRAIVTATNSIMFENYLWSSGPLSDQFIAALTARARAGVDVRMIVDGSDRTSTLGTWLGCAPPG